MKASELYVRHINKYRMDGKPEITVVAVPKKDSYNFGVSICSPKDEWNRRTGIDKAVKRARENPILSLKIKIGFPVSDRIKRRIIGSVRDLIASEINSNSDFLYKVKEKIYIDRTNK